MEPIMDAVDIIRRQLRRIEGMQGVVEEIRAKGKTDGGRTTQFGRDIIQVCKAHNIKQSVVAKLFDVNPSAISQHYNK